MNIIKSRRTIITIILGLISFLFIVQNVSAFWDRYDSQILGMEVRHPWGWRVEESSENGALYIGVPLWVIRFANDWAITIEIQKPVPCAGNCDSIQLLDDEIDNLVLEFESGIPIDVNTISTTQRLEHDHCEVASKDFLLSEQNAGFLWFPNRVFALVCGENSYIIRVISRQKGFNKATRMTSQIISHFQ